LEEGEERLAGDNFRRAELTIGIYEGWEGREMEHWENVMKKRVTRRKHTVRERSPSYKTGRPVKKAVQLYRERRPIQRDDTKSPRSILGGVREIKGGGGVVVRRGRPFSRSKLGNLGGVEYLGWYEI